MMTSQQSSTQTDGGEAATPNKARLDNRWGSLLSSMLPSNLNINPALYAQCRPSGASA